MQNLSKRVNNIKKTGSILILMLLVCSACIRADISQQQHPSLIPLPQSLAWTEDSFPLDRCEAIVIEDAALKKEADRLLKMTGRNMPVKDEVGENEAYVIRLRLGEVISPFGHDEAYHLVVNDKTVVLTANTPHGIFNGLQTLRQLIDSGNTVQGCKITDYPVYQWRGYMVDVGRNYQSVKQLKQQIDVMAHYKLNIFHFHLTENIAWRLQVKRYPQLTAPENMVRNKGKYYTIPEMKELIQYCKDRFITLVPEIDMPGHRAAFKRGMGVDIQRDRGLNIIKNIISEV
jgi:N-acetyl-beta-hexosaminidase